MAGKRTRRLPWLQRTLLEVFGVACVVLATAIAGPRLSFENGVDLSFHFTSVFSLGLCLAIMVLLGCIAWFLGVMAKTSIDVEREAADEAFRATRRTDPGIEAVLALSPKSKSNGEI